MASEQATVRHILGLLDRHSTKTLEHAVQQFNNHKQGFHESLLVELRSLKPGDVLSNVPKVEPNPASHGSLARCIPNKETLNAMVEQEGVENRAAEQYCGAKQYSLRSCATRKLSTSGASMRVTRSRAKQSILCNDGACNKSNHPNLMGQEEDFADARTTAKESYMQASIGMETYNHNRREHPSNSNCTLEGHPEKEIVLPLVDCLAQGIPLSERACSIASSQSGPKSDKGQGRPCLRDPQDKLLSNHDTDKYEPEASNGALNPLELAEQDVQAAITVIKASVKQEKQHIAENEVRESSGISQSGLQCSPEQPSSPANRISSHVPNETDMNAVPSSLKRKHSVYAGPTCDKKIDDGFWSAKTRYSAELEAFRFDSDEESWSKILRLSARYHESCKRSPLLQLPCNEEQRPATLRRSDPSMECIEIGHEQLASCSALDGPRGTLSHVFSKGVDVLERSLQDSGDASEGMPSLRKINAQKMQPARSPVISISVDKTQSRLVLASKSISPTARGQSVHTTRVVSCGDLTYKQDCPMSPKPFSSMVRRADGSMLRGADVHSHALHSSDSFTKLQSTDSIAGHDEDCGVTEGPFLPALEKFEDVMEKSSQASACILKDNHERTPSLPYGPCVDPQEIHEMSRSSLLKGNMEFESDLLSGSKYIFRGRSQSLHDAKLHHCAENTTYSSPRLFSSTGTKEFAGCMELVDRVVDSHAVFSMGASIQLEGAGLTVEPAAHVGGCVSEVEAAPLYATCDPASGRTTGSPRHVSSARKSSAQLKVEEDVPVTGRHSRVPSFGQVEEGEPMVEPAAQVGCTTKPGLAPFFHGACDSASKKTAQMVEPAAQVGCTTEPGLAPFFYGACDSASKKTAQTPQQVSSPMKSASQLNNLKDASIIRKDLDILGFDQLLAQRTVNSQRRKRARSPGSTCFKEVKRVKIVEGGEDSHSCSSLPSGLPRPSSEKGGSSSHKLLAELFSPVRPLQLAYGMDVQESAFRKLIDGSSDRSQGQMEGSNKLCKSYSRLPGLGREYLDTPGISSAGAELADMSNFKLRRWKPDWQLNTHMEEDVGKENQSPVPWPSSKSYSSTSILSEKQANAKARKGLGYANPPAGLVDSSQNRYNLAVDTRSFLDFVQPKQVPIPYPNGKREVRVKALEAAELAKREEERRDYERKMRRLDCNEAKSIESECLKDKTSQSCVLAMAGKGVFDKVKRVAELKMRMDQEKSRKQEEEQRRKEEERKKKEAELADKKRKREDAERRDREEKRKRVEEVQRARKELEERHRMELNEKEAKRKLLEDRERERKAHEEEAKRLRRLVKEKGAERRRKQEEHLKAARLAEKQAERKRKEALLQARALEDDQVSQPALGKLSVLSSESFAVSTSIDWEAQSKSLKCEALRSHYSTPCTMALGGPYAQQQLAHEIQSYEISPYRASSSDDDDEDDRPKKPIPLWARKENLLPQLLRQQNIDPDAIFSSEKICRLEEIFGTAGSRRGKNFMQRSTSGDWVVDHATWKEELEYKRAMGYICD